MIDPLMNFREWGVKPGVRYRDPFTLLTVASTAATGVGSILSANAAKQDAASQAAALETQAKQSDRAAMEQRAQASQEAAQKYTDQRELLSDQQAIAAASGGGASDPTILDLAGDLAGYGYQQRGIIRANGETQARGLEDDGRARRREAKSALRAGQTNARASILSGVTSAAKNYGDFMQKSSGYTPKPEGYF